MNLSNERFVRILSSLKPEAGVETDARRHPRVALRTSVLLAPCAEGTALTPTLGPAYVVRLHDVSCGGLSLSHFSALPVGSQFVIDLPEPAEDEEADEKVTPVNRRSRARVTCLRILCRVVHCRSSNEHHHVLGAQFVRLWTAPAPSLDMARAAAI